jgi:hypothetical protein
MGLVTEQRPVPGLVVYGYLRIAAPNQTRRAALTRAMRGYCERHELALAGIYTDSSNDAAWAPGFTGLLDIIGATRGYGVLIPSPAHLGTGHLADLRRAEITRTGRRLIMIRGSLNMATGRQD